MGLAVAVVVVAMLVVAFRSFIRRRCVALKELMSSISVCKSQTSSQQDKSPRHSGPAEMCAPDRVAQKANTSVYERDDGMHAANSLENEPKLASLEAGVKSWPLSVDRSSSIRLAYDPDSIATWEHTQVYEGHCDENRRRDPE